MKRENCLGTGWFPRLFHFLRKQIATKYTEKGRIKHEQGSVRIQKWNGNARGPIFYTSGPDTESQGRKLQCLRLFYRLREGV